MAINAFEIPDGATHWQEIQCSGQTLSLGLLYMGGQCVLAVEEQSTRPNFRAKLRSLHQLPSFVVTAGDYAQTLRWTKATGTYKSN